MQFFCNEVTEVTADSSTKQQMQGMFVCMCVCPVNL